jgi:hypothetical protein
VCPGTSDGWATSVCFDEATHAADRDLVFVEREAAEPDGVLGCFLISTKSKRVRTIYTATHGKRPTGYGQGTTTTLTVALGQRIALARRSWREIFDQPGGSALSDVSRG